MSGRKQFDEDVALDAAMQAFWTQGFDATSMSDLESATGLNKSSLYNAYDSKEALYLRCLERYVARFGEPLMDALDRPVFVESIKAFFAQLLERLQDGDLPPGCMVTGAACSVATRSDHSRELLDRNLQQSFSTLRDRCDQAHAAGELPAGTDPDQLAALLLITARGMTVLACTDDPAGLPALAAEGVLQLLEAVEAIPATA